MTHDNWQSFKDALQYARAETVARVSESIANRESSMVAYHARYLVKIARALDAVYADYWGIDTAYCFDPPEYFDPE